MKSTSDRSWVTSCLLPLVRESTSGVPWQSTMRWGLLPGRRGRPAKVRCQPPLEGPDVRSVDRRVVQVQVLPLQPTCSAGTSRQPTLLHST